jgi:hypothetical protein
MAVIQRRFRRRFGLAAPPVIASNQELTADVRCREAARFTSTVAFPRAVLAARFAALR